MICGPCNGRSYWHGVLTYCDRLQGHPGPCFAERTRAAERRGEARAYLAMARYIGTLFPGTAAYDPKHVAHECRRRAAKARKGGGK